MELKIGLTTNFPNHNLAPGNDLVQATRKKMHSPPSWPMTGRRNDGLFS
jgi:hypothetical protein